MSEEMIVDMGGGHQKRVPVDYPANSHKLKAAKQAEKEERPPPKRVEKVIEGNVVTRKRKWWQRAGEAMAVEDDGQGIAYYILIDVLIPAAKNMLYEAITQGSARALYGATGIRTRNDRPGGGIVTNYQRIATGRSTTVVSSPRDRINQGFEDVILETRGEAEDVLDGMRELVSVYGVATVADFYDLCGISSPFTTEKYGWNDLRSAIVRHTRGGYLISLPRLHVID
jgi:hypothetical protein